MRPYGKGRAKYRDNCPVGSHSKHCGFWADAVGWFGTIRKKAIKKNMKKQARQESKKMSDYNTNDSNL